jgi:hypothetical protein
VQSKGFGVPVEILNDATETIESDTADQSSAGTRSLADVSGGSLIAEEGLKSAIPSTGPRTYPPPKPHQGSGRQAEPLLRLREELRKGVDRCGRKGDLLF